MVQNYDRRIVLSLLMKFFEILTLSCNQMHAKIVQIFDSSLFGVIVSNEEATHASLVKKLSLFKIVAKLQSLFL